MLDIEIEEEKQIWKEELGINDDTSSYYCDLGDF